MEVDAVDIPATARAATPADSPGARLAETTDDAPAIEAVDLFRFFHAEDGDETLALRGVSLAVRAGEIVAVVGPSGSGKSTLLACLAGLDNPDGGVVRLHGERLSRRPEADRARMRARSIGMLLQSGNLLEHLSVIENVELAQSIAAAKPPHTARELLASVGLADKFHAVPSHLSGGQAARAGLAVALASGQRILLADEPSGEVDSENERGIIELLLGEAAKGTAVVVVTHGERVAAAATRVVHLLDGAVVDG